MQESTANKKGGRLVLSRKIGQTIVIGSDDDCVLLTIVAIDIARTNVRVSIEGPPGVPINRYEIAKKKGLI